MDPMARFSLLEVASVTGVSLKTLKYRFYHLRQKGGIREGSTISAMTYDDVKAILRIPSRSPKQRNNPQARAVLRQALGNDGMI